MGFRDFRVRREGNAAKLQFRAHQMQQALEQRETIVKALKQHYSAVLLDLEERP